MPIRIQVTNTSGDTWVAGELIEVHNGTGAFRRAQSAGEASVVAGWRPIGVVTQDLAAGATGTIQGNGRVSVWLAAGQTVAQGQRAASAGNGAVRPRATESWVCGTFAEARTSGGDRALVLLDLACVPV